MKIEIIKGDITQIASDAIVNAANSSLLGCGGVDGAIHRRAGIGLLNECKEIRKTKLPCGLQTGKAVMTGAYNLAAKYVIHTVGPIYGRDDIDLLRDCYLNCLRLAEEKGCKSINFPAISTGVYGVPIELSAKLVKETLSEYRSKHIGTVKLILFSDKDYQIYKKYFS